LAMDPCELIIAKLLNLINSFLKFNILYSVYFNN